MDIVELFKILDELDEIDEYKKLSLSEQFIYEDGVILGELLNPNESYDYIGKKGRFYYKDSRDNLYCVRLTYNSTSEPYMEFKTGWCLNNNPNNVKYDPPLPDNITSMDNLRRSDTIAKIFRDELIPLFKTQNLTNIMKIQPLTVSRYQYSIRLVKKFIDTNEFDIIEEYPKLIKVIKKI